MVVRHDIVISVGRNYIVSDDLFFLNTLVRTELNRRGVCQVDQRFTLYLRCRESLKNNES